MGREDSAVTDEKVIQVQVTLDDGTFQRAVRNYHIAMGVSATSEEVMEFLRRMVQAEADRVVEYLSRDGMGPPIGTRCAGCGVRITLYELHARITVQRDGGTWHRWCATSR